MNITTRVTVTVEQAKADFAVLLDRVVNESIEILITKAGQPVAMLVPVPLTRQSPREPGIDRGRFEVPDDFNDPLPEDALGGVY